MPQKIRKYTRITLKKKLQVLKYAARGYGIRHTARILKMNPVSVMTIRKNHEKIEDELIRSGILKKPLAVYEQEGHDLTGEELIRWMIRKMEIILVDKLKEIEEADLSQALQLKHFGILISILIDKLRELRQITAEIDMIKKEETGTVDELERKISEIDDEIARIDKSIERRALDEEEETKRTPESEAGSREG